jgi:23S rRNA pseudouridine2605 synthase
MPRDKKPFSRNKPESIALLTYPVRLNKYIAKCGICSRRKAAELVKNGLIKVNNHVVKEPFLQINKEDEVQFQDKILKPEQLLVYILLNKPKNVITTTSDERNRKTILDIVHLPGKERIFPVGRLDRDTTGLLLITNDGDLAKKLSHPSHEVRKDYHVTLNKAISLTEIEKIKEGLVLEDGLAKVKDVAYLHPDNSKEIWVALHIGKNRIVRRLFEHLGYDVVRLDRVYYAGLTKKNLGRGKYRALTQREIIMLKHFT